MDGVAADIGTVKHNDGRRYAGQMKNWNPHGTGVLTYPNGRVHSGEFAGGKRHGAGQVTWPVGTVLSGTWTLSPAAAVPVTPPTTVAARPLRMSKRST